VVVRRARKIRDKSPTGKNRRVGTHVGIGTYRPGHPSGVPEKRYKFNDADGWAKPRPYNVLQARNL